LSNKKEKRMGGGGNSQEPALGSKERAYENKFRGFFTGEVEASRWGGRSLGP